MTKTMEIVEIISEGYNAYYVEVTKVESVELFLDMRNELNEEEEGGWFCREEKDGWFSYGYEGSEYWGLFKADMTESEKDRVMNMDGDELEDFADFICNT